MSFYERFVALCNQKCVKPSRAASDCGINRSNVTNWKTGGYTPRGDALQRLADYFGVTTDYLLTGEQKEKAPALTEKDERRIGDDEIKAAFWGGEKDLSPQELDELWDDVKEYAAYKAAQKRNKKGKQ